MTAQERVVADLMVQFRKGEVSLLDWISDRAAKLEELGGDGFSTTAMYNQLVRCCELIADQLGNYHDVPVLDPEVKISLVRLIEYSWKDEFMNFCEAFGWDFSGVDSMKLAKICAADSTTSHPHIFCDLCRVKLWLREI